MSLKRQLKPAVEEPVGEWRRRSKGIDRFLDMGCGTLCGVFFALLEMRWHSALLKSGFKLAIFIAASAAAGAVAGLLFGRRLFK